MNSLYADYYVNEENVIDCSKAYRGLDGIIMAANSGYLEVTQELISQALRKSYATIVEEIQCGNVSLANKICILADMNNQDGLFKKYIELMLPVYYCVKKSYTSHMINGHAWKSRFFVVSEVKMVNCHTWYNAENFIDFDTFKKVYYMCGGNSLFPLMFLSQRYGAGNWQKRVLYIGRLPKDEMRQIRTILSYAALDAPLFSHYGYFANGRLTTLSERRSALTQLISADLLLERDIMVSDSVLKKMGSGNSLKRVNSLIYFMQKHLGKHCARAKKFIPPQHIQAWRDDIQYLEMQKTTMVEEDVYCV